MSREFTMGIRLNYNDNSFSKGIREASQDTGRFREALRGAELGAGGLMGKLGGLTAALGGIAAAKGAWDWLVGANADMEQYQNTLTVVLKSQAKATETLAWAQKFAAQTPFEIPQIVEATTRMASYGISAKKTLGIVGDMASVMGKDLMQAVEAVADAQTGELERLKEFGITKKMIQDQAKALGSDPINSKGQITDTKAFNAALFSLMEKRFKGGMAMQAKTYKGMLSNAADFMGTLGRRLGQPLFDSAKKNLSGFLDMLNALQNSGAVDRFVSKAQRAFAAIGNEIAYARKVMAAGFRAIWSVAQPVFAFLRKNWADIAPFVQGVAIAIGAVVGAMTALRTATMIATVAMKLMSAAMLTNPVTWVVLAIGLLVGWFIKLNGGLDATKKKLAGWLDTAKRFGSAIMNMFSGHAIKGALDLKALGLDGKQVTEIWKVVGAVKRFAFQVIATFNWLKGQAVTYWPVIQAAIVKAWNYVQTSVIPVVKQIATGIIGMFKRIYAIVVPFVQALIPVLVNAGKTIWGALQPLAATLGRLFVKLAPIVLAAVGGIYRFVTTYLPPVLAVVLGIFRTIFTTVVPLVASIVAGIISGFNAVVTWFMTVWPAIMIIMGRVMAYIRLAWAAIGPFVMAALQILVSVIKNGFMLIMAIVKFVWTTIKAVIEVAWAIISGIIQTALGILTGDWKMAWDGIKTIFEGIWNGMVDFMGGLGTLFYDSGKAIINTLVDGIKAVASAPVKAIKGVFQEVRKFMPFSDAKKGPLSELTYSGGAIVTTMAQGVNKQAGSLSKSVASAFASVPSDFTAAATLTAKTAPPQPFAAASPMAAQTAPTQPIPTAAPMAVQAAPQPFAAASLTATGAAQPLPFTSTAVPIPTAAVTPVAPAAAPSGGAPSITLGSLVDRIEITQQPGEDAESLADRVIDRLHAKAKDAVAILATANKGALLNG